MIHASKVWFTRQRKTAEGDVTQLLTYVRRDSHKDKRQYDVFGGQVDPADHGPHTYATCARREISEELVLSPAMEEALECSLAQAPDGHETVHLLHHHRRHHVVYWFVPTGDDCRCCLTPAGGWEACNGSVRWRNASKVIDNLAKFRFAQPIVALLRLQFSSEPLSPDYTARG